MALSPANDDILVDLESERRVLSGMLNSEDARIEAYDSLKEDDFYYPLHRTVFSLICQLYRRDVKPTFAELLKEAQSLNILRNQQEINELAYIAEHFIEGENISYWLERVKDRSRLRKFEAFLRRHHQKISENIQEPVDNVLMEAEEELTNMTALEIDDRVDSPVELAAVGYEEVERRYLRYKEIKELHKGVLPLDGLPTGFDSLNHVTLGYKTGDLIILGAQTGHGKTAFALHTAKAVAMEHKSPLLYLNTEMSRVQIALRWGSILSQVEHEKLRSGDLSPSEFSEVLQGYSELSNSGFYSYPCPNLTPEKMISIGRKFKAQKDIKMIILDYVGRMDKINPNYAEWQILEQIVKTLKMLGQNLDLAVMCLVQLNDDGTLQGARRMKNESDLMLKLIPVSPKEIEENEYLRKFKDVNYRLMIDKNRDGRSGIDIMIHFDKTRQIMRDAEPVSL
ncbi:MAG: AAA family ATPase [Syntrophomonadaceae bacterium]|nr:AAA family ATPase [Syntrophomonadaceae bacterium]